MNRRIVLFGHSVALDSIAAALDAYPGLELLHAPFTPDTLTTTATRILALEPTAVIFDLTAGLPDSAHLRLLAHSRVTLLGFDLENHHMLVLSGEQTQLQTLDDLMRALALTPEEDPQGHPGSWSKETERSEDAL